MVIVFRFVWYTLHERQEGLNWTDALCPEVLQHLNLMKWTSEWVNVWMKVCVVCWGRCERCEWPLRSSGKTKTALVVLSSWWFLYSFVTLDEHWPTSFAWFSRFFEFIHRPSACFLNHSLYLLSRPPKLHIWSQVRLRFHALREKCH